MHRLNTFLLLNIYTVA